MPRLTQNQRIQALTMLARDDKVSNVSRAFGCHRNTIIRLRQPGNPFGQGGPKWDKCLQPVIVLPVCSGRNGISVGGDSSELGFYFLMSLGLTVVIMTVEFQFLEEEGNVLLINVSSRGTDLEVGVLMVWGGIMGRRKTNLIVVQSNLNAQGYINQILQPEAVPFLQRHGPAILMHENAKPHVARI